MIGYPSGQGGPSLATRDFPRWSPKKTCKLVRSRWLDIDLVLFCLFIFTLSTCSIFSDLARISLVSNAKNFMFSSIYLKKMRTKPACTGLPREDFVGWGSWGFVTRPPTPLLPLETRRFWTDSLHSCLLPPRDLISQCSFHLRFLCFFFFLFFKSSLCWKNRVFEQSCKNK